MGRLEALELVPALVGTHSIAISWRYLTIRVDEEGMAHTVVGDIGALVIKPLLDPQGDVTRLLHGAAAFRENLSSCQRHRHLLSCPRTARAGERRPRRADRVRLKWVVVALTPNARANALHGAAEVVGGDVEVP